jgi:phosphoglycerate-specific signal transduction histidine kinase
MLKITAPDAVTPNEQRRVEILIMNTGSQIPHDKLAQMYRPFTGSKNSSHLGLGLTIASMLCHQMSLQLGLASENNTTAARLSCPVA